jgi:hypothetical protein
MIRYSEQTGKTVLGIVKLASLDMATKTRYSLSCDGIDRIELQHKEVLQRCFDRLVPGWTFLESLGKTRFHQHTTVQTLAFVHNNALTILDCFFFQQDD